MPCDDQLVLPGHKLPFTGLPFRLMQMIEKHESALDRLLDNLAEPKVAVECFIPLFRREIGAGRARAGAGRGGGPSELPLAARPRFPFPERPDGTWAWERLE
jgi:hypothetical protein